MCSTALRIGMRTNQQPLREYVHAQPKHFAAQAYEWHLRSRLAVQAPSAINDTQTVSFSQFAHRDLEQSKAMQCAVALRRKVTRSTGRRAPLDQSNFTRSFAVSFLVGQSNICMDWSNLLYEWSTPLNER